MTDGEALHRAILENPADDTARLVFATIERLDAESRRKPPSVFTVYRLYCKEALSVRQAAKRCRCSIGTIMERLNVIHAETGLAPGALRKFSAHLEKIREDIADSRARHIHNNATIYGEDESD